MLPDAQPLVKAHAPGGGGASVQLQNFRVRDSRPKVAAPGSLVVTNVNPSTGTVEGAPPGYVEQTNSVMASAI